MALPIDTVEVGNTIFVGTSAIPPGSVNTAALASQAVTAAKIANATITGTQIAPGTVPAQSNATPQAAGGSASAGSATDVSRSDHVHALGAGSVGSSQLASSAVTTAAIADHAVTQAKLDPTVTLPIANGAVGNAQLASNAVAAANIQAGAVGNTQLASNAVATGNIQANAVTSAKLASGAVGTTQLASNSVAQTNIQNAAVGNAQLDTNSVGTGNIQDNAVTNSKIASGAVDSSKLASNAVGAGQIAASAVGPTQILSGGVGTAQLADGSVTSSKIGARAVGASQIALANIDNTLLQAGTALANIGAGGVTSTYLAAGAVGTTQLAANAVTDAKVQSGGLNTASIAAGAVTQAKLASGSVGTPQLQSQSVLTGNIADANVTTAKLAANAVTDTQIQSGGLNTASIANNAVTDAKIQSGGLNTASIANNAVTIAKMAANSVGPTQIVTEGVLTANINDLAVTQGKLANGAVGTAQLIDGSVTAAKLASSVFTDTWHNTKTLNIMDFGGVADGVTDNLAAFASLMAAFGPPSGFIGGRVLFPPGNFFFSDTLHLNLPVLLQGAGGLRDAPNTNLIFPVGKTAILVHSAYTLFNGGAGDGSTVEDLLVKASTTAPTWQSSHSYASGAVVVPTSGNFNHMCFTAQGSGMSGGSEPPWSQNEGSTTGDNTITWKASVAAGIRMSGQGTVKNVTVLNFAGDGIYVVADHGGSPFGGPPANANGSRFENVFVHAVSGWGVYVNGHDTGAMYFNAIDSEGCVQGGIYDHSGIGNNTYDTCQCAGTSGPGIKNDQASATVLFLNCYSESGGAADVVTWPGVIMGGTHVNGVTGNGTYINPDGITAKGAGIDALSLGKAFFGTSGATIDTEVVLGATGGSGNVLGQLNAFDGGGGSLGEQTVLRYKQGFWQFANEGLDARVGVGFSGQNAIARGSTAALPGVGQLSNGFYWGGNNNRVFTSNGIPGGSHLLGDIAFDDFSNDIAATTGGGQAIWGNLGDQNSYGDKWCSIGEVRFPPVAKTSNYALDEITDNKKYFSNAGSSGQVQFTLSAPVYFGVTGNLHSFINENTNGVKVVAAGSGVFVYNGTTYSSNITSTTKGSSITLLCTQTVAGIPEWVPVAITGTWSFT